VIQTAELGHERWIPENKPVISKIIQREGWSPRSQRAHAFGVNSAFRRDTSKELLEALRPIRVTLQGWVACIAREQLGHPQDGWPQRLGA